MYKGAISSLADMGLGIYYHCIWIHSGSFVTENKKKIFVYAAVCQSKFGNGIVWKYNIFIPLVTFGVFSHSELSFE